MNYEDHKEVTELLNELQANEKDERERIREAIAFNTEVDGHWDQVAKEIFSEKPMYQFDLVRPAIKTLTDEMEGNEFSARALEASNGADSDVAKSFDGMLRSTQNLSLFQHIRQKTSIRLVSYGFDAWMIVNDWADVDSFDQDLLIKPVQDSVNRAWLGPTSEIDHSDCPYGFLLTTLTKSEYKDAYPDGSGVSVGIDSCSHSDDKEVMIADFFYIKHEKKTLHLMSDGSVIEETDVERAQRQGLTSERNRARKIPTCYMRKMDGKDWLADERRTPFSYVPIIPVYGNYDFHEGKRMYSGETQLLMDSQRVYDYARSREIADGALAPVEKISMGTSATKDLDDKLSDLNSSGDPILEWNDSDPKTLPPQKIPGPQPNAQLAVTAENVKQDIKEISRSYSPARGESIANHSGKAYEILKEQSNMGTVGYTNSLILAVNLASKILIDAYPKIYDTRDRQVRLLNEDGTASFETVNKVGPDGQVIRDLSKGHYDVVTSTGASFSSRKKETAQFLLDYAGLDQSVIDWGKDIILSSLDAPGMDQMRDRVRPLMIQQGKIPFDQLTEEEKKQVAEDMQKQSKPDPIQQATLQAILAQISEANSKVEERQNKMQIEFMKEMREMRELMLKERKSVAEIQKLRADTVESLSEANDGNMESGSVDQAAQQVAKQI